MNEATTSTPSADDLVVVARGRLTLQATTVAMITANEMKKGDVIGTAHYAGLQASRPSTALLPLAPHAAVDSLRLDFLVGVDVVEVTVSLDPSEVTGGRGAALTAATVALLTVYDMCKAVDRTMVVSEVALVA